MGLNLVHSLWAKYAKADDAELAFCFPNWPVLGDPVLRSQASAVKHRCYSMNILVRPWLLQCPELAVLCVGNGHPLVRNSMDEVEELGGGTGVWR